MPRGRTWRWSPNVSRRRDRQRFVIPCQLRARGFSPRLLYKKVSRSIVERYFADLIRLRGRSHFALYIRGVTQRTTSRREGGGPAALIWPQSASLRREVWASGSDMVLRLIEEAREPGAEDVCINTKCHSRESLGSLLQSERLLDARASHRSGALTRQLGRDRGRGSPRGDQASRVAWLSNRDRRGASPPRLVQRPHLSRRPRAPEGTAVLSDQCQRRRPVRPRGELPDRCATGHPENRRSPC